MGKIAIVIYSAYGHIKSLAEVMATGAREAGNDVKIFRVAETLSEEVQGKMHIAKFEDIPVIQPAQLPDFDGFLFGLPVLSIFSTRYGIAPAQMKAFWDATGQLWGKQALANKFAGCFVSTGTQHGGQETTVMSFIPHFVHHGIIFVPLGFSHPALFDSTEVIGGSPWGAGTVAGGDGSRKASEKELAIAKTQGTNFGKIVAKATA
ncbi:hypothetical protein HK101_000614 [Irineochytrium annulatum]|nr:hypothetical protein HK101_000614 [Irineochytrium annulatum]